ncbi:hypothetical protein NLG97_g1957 [Lecanicillium saksenae]|uniref:Uncharacterized protein n=1 Tax=Lecanicillium saksenae TaxID=468837 RepID=A0ACC1R4Y4_9HYPO|nr:hypothetical protein NLG97_g1957 [Lecanicillium saksenae]
MSQAQVTLLLADLESRIGARSVFVKIRGCPAVVKTGPRAGKKCLKEIPAKGESRAEAERIRTYLNTLDAVTDKDLLLQNVRRYISISFCFHHIKKALSQPEWDDWAKLVPSHTPTASAAAPRLATEIIVVSDDDTDSSDIQEDDIFDGDSAFEIQTPDTTVDIEELEKEISTLNVQDSRASSPDVNPTEPSPDDGATAAIANALRDLHLARQTPPPSGSGHTIQLSTGADAAASSSSTGLTNQDEGDRDVPGLGKVEFRRAGTPRDNSVLHHKFYEAFGSRDKEEGIVYILQNANQCGIFKVGYSGKSANARKKQLNNCCGIDTKIIHETEGGRFVGAYRVEGLVHAMLIHCNLMIKCNGKDSNGNDCTAKHREWFKTERDTVVGIARAMERFVRQGGYELRDTGKYHVSEAGDKVVKKLMSNCTLPTLNNALDRMEARRRTVP